MKNSLDRRNTLRRLREILVRTNDDAECQRIVRLIEDVETKERIANNSECR